MAAQGGTLPPIDTIVRSMRIGPDSVTARVLMPQGSLLAHARTTGVPAVDEDMVGTIYCALAERQRGEPAPARTSRADPRRAVPQTQLSPSRASVLEEVGVVDRRGPAGPVDRHDDGQADDEDLPQLGRQGPQQRNQHRRDDDGAHQGVEQRRGGKVGNRQLADHDVERPGDVAECWANAESS